MIKKLWVFGTANKFIDFIFVDSSEHDNHVTILERSGKVKVIVKT